MGLFDFLRRSPAIRSPAALADFLDSRSAFMVQKCVFEYARARSGLLSAKLFKEAAFTEGIEATRWRNYPLCLQSMALMVEHAFRNPAGNEAAPMREGLAALVGDVCRRYPTPGGFEADFWDAARERIVRRIFQAGLAGPHAIKDIPHEISREFFENLPLHPDIRALDFELITNNLRANLCRSYDDFLGVADFPGLIRALVGRAVMEGGLRSKAERA